MRAPRTTAPHRCRRRWSLRAPCALMALVGCSLRWPVSVGDGGLTDRLDAAPDAAGMDAAGDDVEVAEDAALDVPGDEDARGDDALDADDGGDASDGDAGDGDADGRDASDGDAEDGDARDGDARHDVPADLGDAPDATADTVCPTGRTPCDGRCADTQVDLQHCGGCGRRCADGQTCTFGRCVCQPGAADCDGNVANGCEVDTTTHPAHCGGCGMACQARANSTPACAGGRCVPECTTGFANCDAMEANGCEVNTGTDRSNCGGCGAVCQMRPNATITCAAGRCGFSCAATFGDCDAAEANGCEVPLLTTSTHCGRCGAACISGRACAAGVCETSASCMVPRLICSGVCVDPQTDPRNCGACNRVCTTGQTCVAGSCQCPATLSACPAGCTNLTNDRNNCGACGRACAFGASCSGGACVCPAGQTACGGRCVNTGADDANCGMCGRTCAVSGACISGTCLCGGRGQQCCLTSRCGTGLRCSWGTCE